MLAVVAACRFSADPGGARFACDGPADCPDGLACSGGYCAPGGTGQPDAAGMADGGPDGAVVDPTVLEWQESAVGAVDAAALDSVTTETGLAGAPGGLYVAFISMKPPRFVQSVSGLGLVWTVVRQQCTGRDTASLALFTALAAETAEDGQVTALLAGAAEGSAVISVHRYRGANPVEPMGDASWANTNGNDLDPLPCTGGVDTSSYQWSSLDVGSAGSIVVSGVHTASYGSHQPGRGYRELADDQSGGNPGSAGVAVQEQRALAPTLDLEVSGGWDNAPDWAAIAVEIRD